MLALIDADVLVYRCAWAVEKTWYIAFTGEDKHEFKYKKDLDAWLVGKEGIVLSREQRVGREERAVANLHSMVNRLAKEVGATEITCMLSGERNFRNDIATLKPYKGGRPPKPTHYQACRNAVIDFYDTVLSDNEEADDLLGKYQCQCTATGKPSVICSVDKDLQMIPGRHYNFVTKEKKWVDEAEAGENFYRQMLSGDNVDNIPGLKGIAGKRAAVIIDECLGYEELMVGEILTRYQKQWPEDWERYLNEMAHLLWIRRE